jgi:hypothetical protein
MDASSLKTLLSQELKSLADYLEDEDYTNAFAEAAQETGWALASVSTDFQSLWFKRRARRHLVYMLYVESARKFKVDQINLGERFKHYGEIIKVEDAAFEKIKEERPEQFAAAEGINLASFFGQQIGTRHAYDELGRDVTDYSDVYDALQQ